MSLQIYASLQLSPRSIKRSRYYSVFIAGAIIYSLLSQTAYAQTYTHGQHIEPAYEGWERNEDGTFSFLFGYHNENWEEALDIPVGAHNYFSPGEADRGQPEHFLPRRNRFTFKVNVPADWGSKELVWEITANGITRRAFATLAKDYVVDNVVIASETGSLGAGTSTPESRANTPPVVTILGDRIAGDIVRNIRVGETLILQALVVDDGLPKPRTTTALLEEETQTARMMRPPRRVTVGKTNGLFLSWNVFRGTGEVQFDPPQIKPWEDTRASANSPWGALWVPPAVPEDGIYNVNVIFEQPGTYILWARADDGGLYHDQYVTVHVSH